LLFLIKDNCVQWSPLGNGKVTVKHRVTAIIIQVNFAEKIRQLKILGSYPVTVIYRVTAIYRAVIYRIDCILTLQVYVFHVVRLHISKIVINYMYKVIYMVLILPDKRQNRCKFLS